jgi:hypothetical protein
VRGRDAELIANCGVNCLIYGFAFCLLVFFFIQYLRRRSLRGGKNLDEIARRLNGQVHRAVKLEFPFVFYVHKNIQSYLRQGTNATGEIFATSVEACVGINGFFEATSRSWKRTFTPFARSVEVSLHPAFQVRATEGLLRSGTDLRALIVELDSLEKAMRLPVRLRFTLARLVLEVGGVLSADQCVDLDGRLDRVLAILGHEGVEGGFEIVSTAFDPSKGRCPVCAARIEGETRLCGKCRTPHHAECWAWQQGCAIFGCGGRTTG